MSKQSVLLTGASGTVGIKVLEQLIDRKQYKLTVFDKKSSDSVRKLNPFKDKAKIIYGDITREEDVAKVATPRDTTRAFVNAIPEKSMLSGKIFNLGGGESCRIAYHDFLARSFKIYGLGEFNFPKKCFC